MIKLKIFCFKVISLISPIYYLLKKKSIVMIKVLLLEDPNIFSLVNRNGREFLFINFKYFL